MKSVHMITFLLLVVGGLNWLLTAFGWNLVEKLLGSWPMAVKVVYVLVGLSAIFELVSHRNTCRMCQSSNPGASM